MLQLNRSSKTALITAITFILPTFALNVDRAQAKDNPVPKIKVRVEIAGISGDGLGGTIDAFGSDQQIEVPECTGCGGGAGKAVLSPLVITKDIDSASQKLLLAARTGSHFTQARIDWIRRNPITGEDQVYFTILLNDVTVVLFRTRLADQRDPQSLQGAAVEDVGLKAVTTQFSYLQPDGTILTAANVTPSVLAND